MNNTTSKIGEAEFALNPGEKIRKGRTSNRKVGTTNTGPTSTVGFRADQRQKEVIKQRADELGIDVSAFVKQCVETTLLDDSAQVNAFDAFLELKKAIHNLRIDIAISTEALLQTAGKLTAKQSEEWVSENLWRRGERDSK